jgi:23S rRNA-/tRNA-specific pseudouridylate synthase
VKDPSPLVSLYEDEDIVAVQKPSGEPVIPTRDGSAQDCVQRRLERQLGRRLFVVHRIDKDASGVVVFALHAEAHRALSLAFEHRQVAKSYAAFVAGVLEPPQGRLDVALHPARKGKTRPARPGEPGAQAATTDYATVRRWALPSSSRVWTGSLPVASSRDLSSRGAPFGPDPEAKPRAWPAVERGGCAIPADPSGPVSSESLGMTSFVSLLEAHPHTGRHHQIRVHLRAACVPILFDPLYGRGLMPEGLAGAPCARLALHARRIDLPALRGEGRVVIEAPLASDLVALAEWLDAGA